MRPDYLSMTRGSSSRDGGATVGASTNAASDALSAYGPSLVTGLLGYALGRSFGHPVIGAATGFFILPWMLTGTQIFGTTPFPH